MKLILTTQIALDQQANLINFPSKGIIKIPIILFLSAINGNINFFPSVFTFFPDACKTELKEIFMLRTKISYENLMPHHHDDFLWLSLTELSGDTRRKNNQDDYDYEGKMFVQIMRKFSSWINAD